MITLSVQVGSDSDASYSFDPGDVLARPADFAPNLALSRFGGQSISQSDAFQMPKLAGSPVLIRSRAKNPGV